MVQDVSLTRKFTEIEVIKLKNEKTQVKEKSAPYSNLCQPKFGSLIISD